uniref:Uncharacterized protein n=3 Tax=Oryza TaxID=4527 RepID=A0A0D3F6J2_9ORYZ
MKEPILPKFEREHRLKRITLFF